MTGHVPHLDGLVEQLERVALSHHPVDLRRIQPQAGDGENLHALRCLDEGPVLRVGVERHAGLLDAPGVAGVVPVSVGDEQRHQFAAGLFEKGLHLGPDLMRRIDQHGLVARGIGEQVGVGLERPGGEGVDFHRWRR